MNTAAIDLIICCRLSSGRVIETSSAPSVKKTAEQLAAGAFTVDMEDCQNPFVENTRMHTSSG